MNNFLELINIRKSFTTKKKINVLRGLYRKFRLGKTYSIVGPSGSGKSTLLNLISLIDKPTSGTIKFDNNEINLYYLQHKLLQLVKQQQSLLVQLPNHLAHQLNLQR